MEQVRRNYKDIVDRLVRIRAHLQSVHAAAARKEALVAPRFIQQIVDTKVDEGNRIELSCALQGEPMPTVGVHLGRN